MLKYLLISSLSLPLSAVTGNDSALLSNSLDFDFNKERVTLEFDKHVSADTSAIFSAK